MQHYKTPKHFSQTDIINGLHSLYGKIEWIGEVRVIGGEPLLHPEVDDIIPRVYSFPNVHSVAIYTNGTLIPKDISVYKNDKVLFMITDYGELSTKLATLVKILDNNEITYVVKPMGGWTNCGEIKKHNRTAEENGKLFEDCCAKNLATLIGSKLYKCPFEANLNNLQQVDGDACDYCNGRPYNAPTITPAIQRERTK